MTRTIEQIKADIATVEAAYKEAQVSIKAAKRVDRFQNEGGEGYSHADNLSEKAFNTYFEAIQPLNNELFAATWTAEVTAARRAAWNAEVVKCKTHRDVAELSKRMGFTHSELGRAIAQFA